MAAQGRRGVRAGAGRPHDPGRGTAHGARRHARHGRDPDRPRVRRPRRGPRGVHRGGRRAVPLRRRRHHQPRALRGRPGHGQGSAGGPVRGGARTGAPGRAVARGPGATPPAPLWPERPPVARAYLDHASTDAAAARGVAALTPVDGPAGGRPRPGPRGGPRGASRARRGTPAGGRPARRPAPPGGLHLGRDRSDQRRRLGRHPTAPGCSGAVRRRGALGRARASARLAPVEVTAGRRRSAGSTPTRVARPRATTGRGRRSSTASGPTTRWARSSRWPRSSSCAAAGVLVHVDAAAACGHVPSTSPSSTPTWSGSAPTRSGGPPGAGALVVRRGLALRTPAGRRRAGAGPAGRAGSVPALIGFGAAAAALGRRRPAASLCEEARRPGRQVAGARRRGAGGRAGCEVVGPATPSEPAPPHRLPGGGGRRGRAGAARPRPGRRRRPLRVGLLLGELEPSPVLEAMGVDASHSLRLSVGWSTTDADVAAFATAFADVVAGLRSLDRSYLP